MTRAGILDAIAAIGRAREQHIAQRPPFWRPFKRRQWRDALHRYDEWMARAWAL